MGIFQPISAVFLDNNRLLGAKYLGYNPKSVSVQANGIWLYDQTSNPENDKIITIKHIVERGKILSDVMVYYADHDHNFITSYIADTASIENGTLIMNEVKQYYPGKEAQYYKLISLPTDLDQEQIQEIIPHPDIIQFWDLNNFIKRIKQLRYNSI